MLLCRNVKYEGLTKYRCPQNWRTQQIPFDAIEGFLARVIPFERRSLLHEVAKRELMTSKI